MFPWRLIADSVAGYAQHRIVARLSIRGGFPCAAKPRSQEGSTRSASSVPAYQLILPLRGGHLHAIESCLLDAVVPALSNGMRSAGCGLRLRVAGLGRTNVRWA